MSELKSKDHIATKGGGWDARFYGITSCGAHRRNKHSGVALCGALIADSDFAESSDLPHTHKFVPFMREQICGKCLDLHYELKTRER